MASYENDHEELLNLKLGLPGRDDDDNQLHPSSSSKSLPSKKRSNESHQEEAPPKKAQVVGWPPVRRRKGDGDIMYVKVSMDGAPYLRKVDLKGYNNYRDLIKGLEGMFKWSSSTAITPTLTYEDKDGDWMLVGDVPWTMFTASCTRLRIILSSSSSL